MINRTFAFFMFLVLLALGSCSDNDNIDIIDKIENTTWIDEHETSNTAILKINENNNISWSYNGHNRPPVFSNGKYEGKHPFITMKIYGSILLEYDGHFKNDVLYIYDSKSKELLFELKKESK